MGLVLYKALNKTEYSSIEKLLTINSNFIMVNIKIVIVVCVLASSVCASQEEKTGQTEVYILLSN